MTRGARVLIDERGSGSVLMLAIVAAIAMLAGIALPLNAFWNARQGVAGAADAAALAAADTASGFVTGAPCGRAETAARLNSASLDGCDIGGTGSTAGLEATVTVSRVVIGFTVSATARAGPPQAAGRTS